MDLLLSSFKIESPQDIVDAIGAQTYTNTTAEDLAADPATPYVIEAYNGGLYLSFGLAENATLSATFTNSIVGQYTVDAKNHVVVMPHKGIVIITHPPHRPK